MRPKCNPVPTWRPPPPGLAVLCVLCCAAVLRCAAAQHSTSPASTTAAFPAAQLLYPTLSERPTSPSHCHIATCPGTAPPPELPQTWKHTHSHFPLAHPSPCFPMPRLLASSFNNSLALSERDRIVLGPIIPCRPVAASGVRISSRPLHMCARNLGFLSSRTDCISLAPTASLSLARATTQAHACPQLLQV